MMTRSAFGPRMLTLIAGGIVGVSSVTADTGIALYVVDTRIGGPDALAEMSIPGLEELRPYDPGEAGRRWGTAHPRGAIEVVPAMAATR